VTVATHEQGLARFEARAMGSPLRLTMPGEHASAEGAWARVRAEFAVCEEELSRFRSSSALTMANVRAGDGAWLPASRRLTAMAALAWRAQRVTGGLFDARVIEELEELGEHGGTQLGYASGRNGGWLDADPRRARLRLSTPIDSGGIGKGLALRRSLTALRRARALGDGGLLEAGGDIITWGGPSAGAGWRIGVEDPSGSAIPVAVIETRDAAVATSSVRLRSWVAPDGTPVHHLIDPRTRRPASAGLQSVTVAASDPVWAEVWSKALFIGGADAIGAESERRRLAAWWVDDSGRLHRNVRADAMTIWARRPA
jgi:thiamine biosynthesis lipoprotein